MSLRRIAAIAACAGGLVLPAGALADMVIPAGSVTSLNLGAAELACTDLVVAGTLQVGSAPVTNVRNFLVQPGGAVTLSTGSISVGGAYQNQGSLTPGSGPGVVFGNACGNGPAVEYPVPASSGGGLALLAALVAAATLLSRRRLRS